MKLCNLNTAKVLQKLGYNGEYAKSYTDFGNPTFDITTSLLYPTEIPAPRLDDAAYFLRDKFGLSIRLNYVRMPGWFGDILNISTGEYIDCNICQTYDEALEAAVNKAIEIIKSLKQ